MENAEVSQEEEVEKTAILEVTITVSCKGTKPMAEAMALMLSELAAQRMQRADEEARTAQRWEERRERNWARDQEDPAEATPEEE